MKQKILYFGFLILLSGMFQQTYAKTVGVESLSEFSTANPPKSISVKLVESLELTNGVMLNAGDEIQGELVDVKSPKRLKRDAGFSFKPKSYIDTEGKMYNIENDIIASYTEPVDKGNLAKNAALGVGSFFVKGLSLGYAAVEGAVKNDEDNRLKSSAVSVYESSPLSYVNKGEDIKIEKSQIFYLKFPEPKTKNQSEKSTEQNYTYTIEKE